MFAETHTNSTIPRRCRYHTFGSQMPGRAYTSSSGAYRYGFNGKEKDDEVKGNGNSQDYGTRIYDSRTGKFLSVDPIGGQYPWNSSYAFAENSPIAGIDLDGTEFFYSADGNLIGRIGTSTEIRVIDESKVSLKTAAVIIKLAKNFKVTSEDAAPHLDKFSMSLTAYAKDVPDVLKDAPLESWADNGQNCYKAATQQMDDAGQKTENKYNAIQTDVDNSRQPKSEQLTENKAGGLIYVMTQLKNGKPVMVGVKETATDDTHPNVNNYNRNTGHFIVITSMQKTSSGFTLGYYDNANSATGKSTDNKLGVDTGTGSMKDDTNVGVGGVKSYEVSEVRKNK